MSLLCIHTNEKKEKNAIKVSVVVFEYIYMYVHTLSSQVSYTQKKNFFSSCKSVTFKCCGGGGTDIQVTMQKCPQTWKQITKQDHQCEK